MKNSDNVPGVNIREAVEAVLKLSEAFKSVGHVLGGYFDEKRRLEEIERQKSVLFMKSITLGLSYNEKTRKFVL